MAAVTPWRPAPPTLEQVRDPDGPCGYPVDLLAGCKTGLVLFAARWFGRQDAFWIADAGIDATCVDVDEKRLHEMERIYPFGWEFAAADAFEYAEFARSEGRKWDVVSLDPFTDLFGRVNDHVDLWCSLASRLVVIGHAVDMRPVAPSGWHVARRSRRSDFRGGVYWSALVRGS